MELTPHTDRVPFDMRMRFAMAKSSRTSMSYLFLLLASTVTAAGKLISYLYMM